MKISKLILGATIIISFILPSCGSNDSKQKELELKEKELALREKELELALKEKGLLNNDSMEQKSEPSLKSESKKDFSPENPKSSIQAKKNQSVDEKTSNKQGFDEYDFENHGNISTFMNDLAKAVSNGDKSVVAEMFLFPLKDEWGDNPFNRAEPLSCRDIHQFFTKYDKIFTNETKESIKNKKIRGYTENTLHGDVIEPGEYLIENKRGIHMLGIKKKNGKFKIYSLKFYS